MGSWTIVAIPQRDDKVWRVSSEKVPHMTLLHLGEQNSEELEVRIAGFLQHIAESESLQRFTMSVDRRGVLGDKNADVLFFKDEDEWAGPIKDARAALLQEGPIADAYNSTEQYPGWTPHLTLGYPETPARADSSDYPGINWVFFDQIALWNDDYEGYEFVLNTPELAMSGVNDFDEVLAHYGVPGMKWGRRKKETATVDLVNDTTGKATPISYNPKKVAVENGQFKTDSKREAKKVQNQLDKAEVKNLSDAELRQRINRIQMEKQYSQLTAAEVNPGKKIVTDLLATTAKNVAASYAQQYARKGIDALIAQAAAKK